MQYSCAICSFPFSFVFVRAVCEQKKSILRSCINEAEKRRRTQNLAIDGASIESLCLYFTYPGQDELELVPGGQDVLVTHENIEEYVLSVLRLTLRDGIEAQVNKKQRL